MVHRARPDGACAQVGVRGLLFSPTRELALQTLKAARELAKFTDLRFALAVGGDGLEEQFAALHANPDVVVATPGRFIHLCMEMRLDLRTVEVRRSATRSSRARPAHEAAASSPRSTLCSTRRTGCSRWALRSR